MIKKINKLTALLLAWTFVLGTMGITSVFAAETVLDFAGIGHTKYNDVNYIGTDLSMAGSGQTSGHVLFFQYDISRFSADTIVNSAVWKAFCNDATNWNNPTIRIMTFDCERSLGTFAVNHNNLLANGYVEDSNILWSGSGSSISAISFTSEIPIGESAVVNRYNIDFTEAVSDAIKAGKKYFNFVIKPYTGYNDLCFYTEKNPMPQLILDTVTSPNVLLEHRTPVEEGVGFDIKATVTVGDAEIDSVVLTVEDAAGTKYTDFSEPVISDSCYVWSFPNTIPSNSYTITVTVTDQNSLTSSDSINMRVLGTEVFGDVFASAPVKKAVTYKGKWFNSKENLTANDNSVIAYFEYDLSENAVYNIKGAKWGCSENKFSGTAALYAITDGWDEESIKNGNVPGISAQPIATATGLDNFDVSDYISENLKKGASRIGFALKTLGGTAEFEVEEMFLTLEQSDNKRPEISAETNKCFTSGDIIDVLTKDDDFVTAVTSSLDGVSCAVTECSNGQWGITLPLEIESGIHKLTVSARDYSGAESVAEYAINIGTGFGEHSLAVSGGTATATVTSAENGMVLLLVAYKNGAIQQLSIESDIVGGELSTMVDMTSEGSDGISYKSYLCEYSDSFKLLDVQ